MLTKRFAQKFGIPIPELYAVVENHGSIASLPGVFKGLREFVVKPARGAGGSGIILIREKTAEGFVTQSGTVMTMDDLQAAASFPPRKGAKRPAAGKSVPGTGSGLLEEE